MVDPKPGFNRVVNNFAGKDYQTIGLATFLSMPFGYFAGTGMCLPCRGPRIRGREYEYCDAQRPPAFA